MSVLVALLGAVVGAAIGVAITYGLLSDAGVDALVWAVTGVFFCVPLMLGGAVATGLLGRRLVPGVFRSGRPGTVRQGRYGFGSSVMYGIGASIVVLVVGPAATIYYTTRGTSKPELVAGELCKKSGIRYIGTAHKVKVCFTLTADRSAYVEIGWRFGRASACYGATGYSDSRIPLASPGQINEPGFTATIRGAHASGVLEDAEVCPGRTFTWSAREVAP